MTLKVSMTNNPTTPLWSRYTLGAAEARRYLRKKGKQWNRSHGSSWSSC